MLDPIGKFFMNAAEFIVGLLAALALAVIGLRNKVRRRYRHWRESKQKKGKT